MTRIGGYRVANCTLDAPGYGRRSIVTENLGYGMSIQGSEGGGRRFKAWYPFVRTSGAWYVDAVFPSVEERDALSFWLTGYIMRVTDPYKTPLSPITVSLPAHQFLKVGYPASSLDFGDEFGTGVYKMVLSFVSASDPTTSSSYGSKYVPPLNDAAARHFSPAGVQESDLDNPVPTDFVPLGDDPWGNSGGGAFPLRVY